MRGWKKDAKRTKAFRRVDTIPKRRSKEQFGCLQSLHTKSIVVSIRELVHPSTPELSLLFIPGHFQHLCYTLLEIVHHPIRMICPKRARTCIHPLLPQHHIGIRPRINRAPRLDQILRCNSRKPSRFAPLPWLKLHNNALLIASPPLLCLLIPSSR